MGKPKDGSFHEGLHSLLLGQGWLNAWKLSNFHLTSDDFSMPFEVPVPKLGEEVHGADNQSRFCVFFFVGFFLWMLLR